MTYPSLGFHSTNQGYAARFYLYKYGKGINLEDLKFKNLRDVEDFIHSDQPGAKIHRRAMDKRRWQAEQAFLDKTERKALRRMKKQEKEEKKNKKKLAKGGEKGSRGSHSKTPKARVVEEGEGEEEGRKDGEDGSSKARKRHAQGEGSKKEKKRRKRHEGPVTKSGGGGAGTSGDESSGKDQDPGSGSEGSGKRKGIEDKVEKEIMEIVGAYSNPQARKELLAQLREHARQETLLHQEKKGAAVPEAGDELRTNKGAEGVSGQQSDVVGDEKTEEVLPAGASPEHAHEDAPLHQEKKGTAVSEPGDKPKTKKDAEEVSGQQSDVAMGESAEGVSSPRAEGGQEDGSGHKHGGKGKKKEKPARAEQRRSPRTSREGRAASFFGGDGGGGTSIGAGDGKNKRKADPLSSTSGRKRQSGAAGREDDDNRRQSSRAASAAATAAMTGGP